MEQQEFLRAILPANGIIFIQEAIPKADAPGEFFTRFHPVTEIDDAVEAIKGIVSRNHDAYYGMASFKEVIYKQNKQGKDYPTGRTQANVRAVKSLWLDLDVGKEGAYATQREAATDVMRYVTETGLPKPMLVTSGYGLHVYWPFDEAVTPEIWASIATIQRSAWVSLGVKADPACDQDCSRVLRPVGAMNFKRGGKKVVRVLHPGDGAYPAMELKRRLQGFASSRDLTVASSISALPSFMQGAAGNLGDLGTTVYPDSFASIVVNHCKQVQDFANTGGSSEPVWYANLGVLKHCKDGIEKAQVWSAKHDDYDGANTQAKFDQWEAGPTTCDKFRSINAAGCEGCKHECKSPIQLGYSEVPVVPVVEIESVVVMPDENAPAVPKSSFTPDHWPEMFGFDSSSERIYVNRKDANGVVVPVSVATPLFYPEVIITDEMDVTNSKFRMIVHIKGERRSFTMRLGDIVTLSKLKECLASLQIQVFDDKGVSKYMSDYMTKLRKYKEEISTYTQFGWKHNDSAFLIGDTLITEKATRKIELNPLFKDTLIGSMAGTSGTKEEWAYGINKLYNVKNGEPYQLAICVAFGAILNKFLGEENWKGIPFSFSSSSSGWGKSTAINIGLNIYGKSAATVMTDFTVMAGLQRCSLMNNVPFLYDEVTTSLKRPEDLSRFLYSLSYGRPRDRLLHSGQAQAHIGTWDTPTFMAGNREFLHQLANYKDVDSDATAARIFAIDLDMYRRLEAMDKDHPDFSPENASDHAMTAQHLQANCYGTVGVEWIQFVIKNKETITASLKEFYAKFRLSFKGDPARERYYLWLLTCSLVGGMYAKKLGFHDFDMTHLRKWATAHMDKLRSIAQENDDTPSDTFAHMMSGLVEHLLVTKRFTLLDGRNSSESEMSHPMPRKTPEGRLALGYDSNGKKERPKLYITTKAVNAWCAENGVNYHKMKREFMAVGLIRLGSPGCDQRTGTVRIAIGRGIPGYTHLGNPRCFEFDAEVASKMVAQVDETEDASLQLVVG